MVCKIYQKMACQKSHDVKKIFEDKINYNESREPQYFVYSNEEKPSRGVDGNKVGWGEKECDQGIEEGGVGEDKVGWGNKKYDQGMTDKRREGRDVGQRKHKGNRESEEEEGENKVDETILKKQLGRQGEDRDLYFHNAKGCFWPFGDKFEFAESDQKYTISNLNEGDFHPMRKLEKESKGVQEDDLFKEWDMMNFLFLGQEIDIYTNDYLDKLRDETIQVILKDPELIESAIYGFGIGLGFNEGYNIPAVYSLFQEERVCILKNIGKEYNEEVVEEKELSELKKEAAQLDIDKEIVRKQRFFKQIQGREESVYLVIQYLKGEIDENEERFKFIRSINSDCKKLFNMRENLMIKEGLLFVIIEPHINRRLKLLLFLAPSDAQRQLLYSHDNCHTGSFLLCCQYSKKFFSFRLAKIANEILKSCGRLREEKI